MAPPSALQAAKRKEAEELLRQADKCLAKTMLRWNPDHLTAAPLLEKAGDAFRAAGDFAAAKRAFAAAAAAQLKNKSLFRAAQNHESIAKAALQQLRDSRAAAAAADRLALLGEVAAAFDAASGYYSDMGEMGKAADALLKAATTCEENGLSDPKQLRDLYLRACALLEAQDKPHFAVEPLRKTVAFFVKHALFADALQTQARLAAVFRQIEQPANVHKLHLSEVVLLLATGDVAAADQAYMRQLQDDAFLSSDECALAEDLVRAFKMGNEDLLQVTVRKQGFSFLDNQIARLSRKLTIYGGGRAPPAAPAAAASSRTQSRERQQPRTTPPKPAPAATSNPFAPTPAPVRAAPAPISVQVPTAPSAPPASSQSQTPATAFETEEIGEFNFDDTTARATVAFGHHAEDSLAFDFESLAFSMPTESSLLEEDAYDATITESSSSSHASGAATSHNSSREQTAPPVAAAGAPPMDDDMFDLT